MSQRNSGYARQPRELYETPPWVTDALIPHLPRRVHTWWECCCGNGLMVEALCKHGFAVYGTDIAKDDGDFLKFNVSLDVDIIGTNPPYNIAQEIIAHALRLTWPTGMVAMLLPDSYDAAITRRHLFEEHPAFCKTVVLRKRIKWFDSPVQCKQCNGTGKLAYVGFSKCTRCKGTGKKKSGPSENHSWFIWDWQHKGPSTKAYGP